MRLRPKKKRLIEERETLVATNENERRISLNHINAKLQLLDQRIGSAKVVDRNNRSKDGTRFRAFVTLKIGDAKKLQKYQIVGVDEADVSKGKISFIFPMAKLLTNKKRGTKPF